MAAIDKFYTDSARIEYGFLLNLLTGNIQISSGLSKYIQTPNQPWRHPSNNYSVVGCQIVSHVLFHRLIF